MSLPSIVRSAATKNSAAVRKYLSVPPDPPPTYTAYEADMVARLRELGVAGWVGRRPRQSIIVTVAEFLEAEARRGANAGSVPFWVDLNSSPAQVAAVFVDMVVENPKGVLSTLPRIGGRQGTGRQGAFNGWLFQRYALNHVGLHRQLRTMARDHIRELNAHLGRSPGGLIDVQGAALDLRGRAGDPVRATDFWLSAPRETEKAPELANVDLTRQIVWEEWMDCAYLAPIVLQHRGPSTFWAITSGLEIKRPGAAKDFNRQLGGMLGRMTASDVVKFTLDGAATETVIPTRAIVFLPESRWLIGATRSLTNTPEFDFISTRTGGYHETFLRMGIRFDTTPIDRLSDLLFRAIL